MTNYSRYLRAKDKFLDFSYLALADQFSSKKQFLSFFEAIESDDQKGFFLKTASFYLFLVKQGSWSVKVHGSNEKIDYLDDTYKYIAIFSLIESLNSSDNFIDFYSYLISTTATLSNSAFQSQ